MCHASMFSKYFSAQRGLKLPGGCFKSDAAIENQSHGPRTFSCRRSVAHRLSTLSLGKTFMAAGAVAVKRRSILVCILVAFEVFCRTVGRHVGQTDTHACMVACGVFVSQNHLGRLAPLKEIQIRVCNPAAVFICINVALSVETSSNFTFLVCCSFLCHVGSAACVWCAWFSNPVCAATLAFGRSRRCSRCSRRLSFEDQGY